MGGHALVQRVYDEGLPGLGKVVAAKQIKVRRFARGKACGAGLQERIGVDVQGDGDSLSVAAVCWIEINPDWR